MDPGLRVAHVQFRLWYERMPRRYVSPVNRDRTGSVAPGPGDLSPYAPYACPMQTIRSGQQITRSVMTATGERLRSVPGGVGDGPVFTRRRQSWMSFARPLVICDAALPGWPLDAAAARATEAFGRTALSTSGLGNARAAVVPPARSAFARRPRRRQPLRSLAQATAPSRPGGHRFCRHPVCAEERDGGQQSRAVARAWFCGRSVSPRRIGGAARAAREAGLRPRADDDLLSQAMWGGVADEPGCPALDAPLQSFGATGRGPRASGAGGAVEAGLGQLDQEQVGDHHRE